MSKWWRVGYAVLCGFFALASVAPVLAQSSTVTIGVGDTILQVNGLTSPNAFVTITRDGNTIGATVANADGTFSQTFPAQEPGLHQLSVYAHTSGGQDTDPATTNINIAGNTTTVVHVFLPPTLMVEDTSLESGQALQLSGEAAPGSTISIYIDNTEHASTAAGADGIWKVVVTAATFAGGTHEVFARASDAGGNQSHPTSPRAFTVASDVPAPLRPRGTTRPAVPVIIFPRPHDVVNQHETVIKGTAQSGTQIEVWDATRSLGSVWTGSDGNWSLPLQFNEGNHTLRARACVGNVCSAFSPSISFTYTPATPLSPLDKPLSIIADRHTFTISLHQYLTLPATIRGGQPPYTALIQWDTTAKDRISITAAQLSPRHRYDTPGRYQITLDVRDAQGRTARAYFTVEVLPERSRPYWIFGVLLFIVAIAIIILLLRRKMSRSA